MLLAVGRMKPGPERELMARYVDRAAALARRLGLSGVVVREVEESRARLPAQRKQDEARALVAELPGGAVVLALDERGEPLSSPAFAAAIGHARDRACPALALVVGGPDGLDAEFCQAATRRLSYGQATFPHQIVRILAAEQIYRALTILAGHPYHRA